ncbi:MAG: NAD(P)-dependent oxidoreductase [Nitrososphaerota archaeon]|nr:NAD(P)-dependent oxidoreductase [Candidatus Bathyarchaeota archaeon]MDW8049365.1 NAD(P)-dependent oxidoreductase [Nitrososphaerota archaeon]
MNVLVTGGAGYIGSILMENLLERGYSTICLDMLFFGDVGIKHLVGNPCFKLIKEDTRSFDPSLLKDIDVVVDLASISQPDPSGQIDPIRFMQMNLEGPVRVASLSKKYGVRRYIFASTCSVYGFQTEILNEQSPLKPLEEYGRTKAEAEKRILPLSNDKFCVTILRFATCYGSSRKMRFDLVINGMTLSLFKSGKIRVMRPGSQWRPFVHVKDVSEAILKVMEADSETVNREVFNVGSNDQNFRIYDLAKLIGESIGVSYEIEWYGEPDTRSYIVNFDKISNKLGFKAAYTPGKGAKEIFDNLKQGILKDTDETYVIKWYKQLFEMNPAL